MRIFADTSAWMPNYRFAYIAVWAGLVFCLIGLVFLFFTSGEPLSIGICAFVAVYCLIMIFQMPRWALDAREEKERRRRAKAARKEMR